MIKSTNYCNLLAEGYITDPTDTYKMAVEKIFVKDISQNEIRFAYYKKNENSVFALVPRPLDVTEDELLYMLISGLGSGVFSTNFLDDLKKLLVNVDFNAIPTSNLPMKSTSYCDLCAETSFIDTTGTSKTSIEKIFIKELNQFEIRFAYYKQNAKGNFNLVLRPLDLPESELLTLFKNSIPEGIFSKTFLIALTHVLN